jgi:hypothetical protein
VLRSLPGEVRYVQMPYDSAQTLAAFVQGGGKAFEWDGVLYPCRGWVASASTKVQK